MTLRTGDRAIRRVSLGLLRVRSRKIERTGWSGRGERVEGRPRRFRFEPPADLERANRLDIFVRYRDRIGDADLWARIVRCRPDPPPAALPGLTRGGDQL